MVDTQRPTDPFTKMAEFGTDQQLFQDHHLPDHRKENKKPIVPQPTQAPTQKVTQKVTQINKKVSNLAQPRPNRLTAEEVEDLAYHLRKERKVRVNADVPIEWKDQLDDLAHKLRVGKYELMLYVIAKFLGKEHPPKGDS